MCKKQSTNFIILSLQRHEPLYPQNISLGKKQKKNQQNKTLKKNSFMTTVFADRSDREV